MLIGCPKETAANEKRVALTPDSAQQLQKLGYDCMVEAGAGIAAGFNDAAYDKAGVKIAKNAAALFKAADIVIKVIPPTAAETKHLRKDQTLISFFYPAQNTKQMEALAKHGANVIAMDMVPRISRAQKMDALSSMANIAGYRNRPRRNATAPNRPLCHRRRRWSRSLPGGYSGRGDRSQPHRRWALA